MKTLQQFARSNRSFLIFFALLTLFLSQQHAGFMMVLFMPPALLALLVRLAIGWRVREKRTHGFLAIAVVLVASAVVAGVHVQRHLSARAEADQLVLRVLEFREKQGRFPKDESELGGAASRDGFMRRPHYALQPDGQPALFYLATFIVFETWQYDFSSQTWSYNFD